MDFLFLIILFVSLWLIVKLLLLFISFKFKINVNFKFHRNHLKDVSISKSISSSDTLFTITIDKIWLSSCYVNRNVNERFLICFKNVIMSTNGRQISNNNDFKLPKFVIFYLNYLGGVQIDNLKVNLKSKECDFDIKRVKLDLKSRAALRLVLDDLNLQLNYNEVLINRLALSLSDLKNYELEIDKINLNIKEYSQFFDLKTSNGKQNLKLNYLKSVLINKLVLNNRHALNRLEFYNTNLDYWRVSLNSLNDLMISKTNRLIDNLVIEIFNNKNLDEQFYDLVVKCDQTNLYLHLIELRKLYEKLDGLKNYKSTQSGKNIRLELKLNNFYVTLIDSPHNEIYVLGCLLFDMNTNLKNLVKFETENFVVFKSSPKHNDKYANNLFAQTNDLRKLFDWINYKKFKFNRQKCFEHVWGNLVNCNTCKLKLKISETRRKFLNFSIDQLFIEHSSSLVDTLFSTLNPLGSDNKKSTFVNFKINQLNVLHVFEKTYFLHFGLRDINFKKQNSFDLNLKMFNCVQNHLSNLPRTDSQFSLNQNMITHIKDDDNSNLIFLFKMISLTKKNSSDYFLTLNDVLITWSLKFHFILNEILFKPFKRYNLMLKTGKTDSNFRLKVLVETNVLLNFLFDYSQDSTKKDFLLPKSNQSYRYFNSNFRLVETLSFILSNFYFSCSKEDFNMNINEISVFTNTDDQSLLNPQSEWDLNKHKFIHVYKLSILVDDKSEYLVNERKLLGTKIQKNKILFTKFDLIYINFLFSYDFAKLIDHLLNLRKCLYKIHEVDAKKNMLNPTPEDGISPDFVLNIKQIKLVIEDDPFEVKLSYNYSLIVDEYLESIKRRQSLEQRRSIRENNLENKALEMLIERESKIYIQRSKTIYSSLPRTELFCLCAENFELKALSDSDWHGRQKCYNILREIDYFSSPPPKLNQDTVDFNPADHFLVLWCRHINLNIQDLKFIFRDYTQPLLKINRVNFYGKFLGAEYEVPFRSRRQVKISISNDLKDLDYCNYIIERNMSPFKFYHDLSSKMNVFSFAYGPCWEGCMAQLNLSLDKIIHPARDPSKPMPWWDKCRLYLHGRLSLHIQQCQIIYHVSMDPYNRTEEMKLVWSPLIFDWKNMEMSFDGGLDIFLNTESKYDDCCLLHLPNLKFKIKIDWVCKAQIYNKSSELRDYEIANAHNFVTLCAPDKVPLVVNSQEHDSYSQFRSENVNLSFSFECKLIDADLPTCKFYASTSRFLEKIKNLLSAITRPTKRGKLFENLKPRKAILSRHFKCVRFNFIFPKINLIYWSSASEQYGIQLESDNFLMNSLLKLELTPFLDKLKRRPKPNWTVDLMKFSVNHTSIYLMSPSEGQVTPSSEKSQNNPTQIETDPFMLEMNERSIKFSDSKPAVRNFFMKIDSISYDREKLCQYNFYPGSSINLNSNYKTLINASMSSLIPIQVTNLPKHNLLIKNLKAQWNTVNRDVVYILYEIYNKSKRLRHNLSAHTLKQYDLFTDQLLQNHLMSQYKNQQRISRKSSVMTHSKPDKNHVGKNLDHFEELLNKLDAEKAINSIIFCNDKPTNQSNSNFNNLIYGLSSTKMSDILSENISIELINSQIKLTLDDSASNPDSFLSFIQKPKKPQNGESQQDYVIISAARANVVQHVHRPVWKSQRYLDKISWSGHLENMQYFATLNKCTDSEYWLSEDLIKGELPPNFVIDIETVPRSLPNFEMTRKNEEKEMCKERSKRGKGSKNKLAIEPPVVPVNHNNQLQLIVSKCRCEFFMIGFYDKIPDDSMYNPIQDSVSTFNLSNIFSNNCEFKTNHPYENNQYLLDLNSSFNEPIDCFTLIHHDINLACNSAQYKLFMEIVNNLVLYFRPRRKKIIDRQKSIKFNLQLSMGNLDSLKQYIQLKQIETKHLLCNLRHLEKQIFYLKEKIEKEINEYNLKYGHLATPHAQIYVIQELKLENKNMEKQYRECKKMLNELSNELNILISCYKEMMVEKRAYNLAQTPMFLQHVMENEKNSNPWQFLSSNKNKFSDLIDLDQLAQQSILNSEIPKRYEIWFKNTKWRLNDDDGHSGLAKFLMKNFLYTKVTNQQELDCVEHNLEIEFCKLQDLVPSQGKNKQNNKFYEDVLKSLFENSEVDGHKGDGLSDDINSSSVSSSTSASLSMSNSSSISSLSLSNANETSLNNSHHSTMIRIFCKERPPVGIPVIEHLELNVSPLMINLTNRFFKKMIKYFFENQVTSNTQKGSNHEEQLNNILNLNNANTALMSPSIQGNNLIKANSNQNKVQSPSGLKNILSHHKRPSQSSLLGNSIIISSPNIILANSNNSINTAQNNETNSNSNQLQNEDIEIMKQRSANNNTFLCIKIPEIQLLVSYKGSNIDKKNIKDLNNVSLLFPLFEVHDKTWTWLDLINALKSHVKKALLSQAIKHKLMKIPIQPVNKLINRNKRSHSTQQLTDSQIEEHEKLTLLKLFGTKFIEKNSQFSTPSTAVKEENDVKKKLDVIENSPVSTIKKGLVAKSRSSIGFGFKRHFMKMNKDKTETNESPTADEHFFSSTDQALNNVNTNKDN